MEKANNLARIDRYLCGLEELTRFFISVRQMLKKEKESAKAHITKSSSVCSYPSGARGDLEAEKTLHKILREQKHCRTYIRHFDTLIQMAISLSTTLITSRLDSGRLLAERFAKIGLVLAGVASIISPMSVLTSYYGMNVNEFVQGATSNLYEFWRVGMPVLCGSFVGLGMLVLWILTDRRQMDDAQNPKGGYTRLQNDDLE
jgi:Mg2+ and Co2+ transporter CorA